MLHRQRKREEQREKDKGKKREERTEFFEDYLFMSCPTRGLVYERQFPLADKTLCKVVYVGSSRGEAHYNYDVNVVFFVANLATSGNTKQLEEDLEFFERVCNARSLVTAHICLLLNKQDLFERVLSREGNEDLKNIHEKYADRDCRPWDGTLLDPALFPVELTSPVISSISSYLGRLLPIYYTTLTDSTQCQAIFQNYLT